MVTEQEWTEAVQSMRAAGTQAGKASASWLVDGNTDEATLRTILQQWEDGDPAAPCSPDPLSGEWADMPTLGDIVGAETDYDPDTMEAEEADELGEAYCEAFAEAWHTEAERSVRAMLPD